MRRDSNGAGRSGRLPLFSAASILLILELLSFSISSEGWEAHEWKREATRYAIGFPVPFVSYTRARVEGDLSEEYVYPGKGEWHAGVGILWPELGLDVLVAGSVVVVLLTILIGDTPWLGAGMVLGVALGALFDALHPIRLPFQGGFGWLPFLFLLVPAPLVIAGWSHSAPRPARARLAMSIGAACVCAASTRFVDRWFEEPISSGTVRWTEVIVSSVVVGAILLGVSAAFASWNRRRAARVAGGGQ
jgi:hypothetical protein